MSRAVTIGAVGRAIARAAAIEVDTPTTLRMRALEAALLFRTHGEPVDETMRRADRIVAWAYAGQPVDHDGSGTAPEGEQAGEPAAPGAAVR